MATHTQSSPQVLGKWIDERFGEGQEGLVTLIADGDEVTLAFKFFDESTQQKSVVEVAHPEGRRFNFQGEDFTIHGEHVILNPDGTLSLRDNDGLIATFQVAATSTASTRLPLTQTPTSTFYQVGKTDGDGVYLRESAGGDERIKAWPDGTLMMVVGPDQFVDDRLWRPVQDPDGNMGFVPVEYLVTHVPPTPTLTSTITPTGIPTPRSTPTPRVGLAQAKQAVLWVYLSNDSYLGVLEVFAQPSFEVPSLELLVFVEGTEFCNFHDLYPDEAPLQLDCGFEQWVHDSIQNVSARTDTERFRCIRNVASNAQRSVFACEMR